MSRNKYPTGGPEANPTLKFDLSEETCARKREQAAKTNTYTRDPAIGSGHAYDPELHERFQANLRHFVKDLATASEVACRLMIEGEHAHDVRYGWDRPEKEVLLRTVLAKRLGLIDVSRGELEKTLTAYQLDLPRTRFDDIEASLKIYSDEHGGVVAVTALLAEFGVESATELLSSPQLSHAVMIRLHSLFAESRAASEVTSEIAGDAEAQKPVAPAKTTSVTSAQTLRILSVVKSIFGEGTRDRIVNEVGCDSIHHLANGGQHKWQQAFDKAKRTLEDAGYDLNGDVLDEDELL